MASASTGAPLEDFDFWEFVCCGKCYLPFSASSEGTALPSVPFWVTECAHIVCNSHLNADQSCPCCGAARIELMPLQYDMPAPMSDWFGSVHRSLDAAVQATHFQQQSMAALVRHYKQRFTKQRAIMEQFKGEIMEAKNLKTEIDHLRRENEQLRQSRGYAPDRQQEPAQIRNENGKRVMGDHHRLSTSSPRSIVTPLGPPRLTLPPGQEQPLVTARNSNSDLGQAGAYSQHHRQALDRPGSSRFNERYAYNLPQSSQMQLQQQQILSHEQQGPSRMLSNQQPVQAHPQNRHKNPRMMPPPPTPVRARPAQDQQNVPGMQSQSQNRFPWASQNQGSSVGFEHTSQPQSTSSRFAFTPQQSQGHTPTQGSVPASGSSRPPSSATHGKGFLAPTTSGSRRFVPSTPAPVQQQHQVRSQGQSHRQSQQQQQQRFVPSSAPPSRPVSVLDPLASGVAFGSNMF